MSNSIILLMVFSWIIAEKTFTANAGEVVPAWVIAFVMSDASVWLMANQCVGENPYPDRQAEGLSVEPGGIS